MPGPAWGEGRGPLVLGVVGGGGRASLAGAFVASLFIGIVQTFAVAVDYSLVGRITVSQVAPVLPYLIMVAILIARPRGLLGTRES